VLESQEKWRDILPYVRSESADEETTKPFEWSEGRPASVTPHDQGEFGEPKFAQRMAVTLACVLCVHACVVMSTNNCCRINCRGVFDGRWQVLGALLSAVSAGIWSRPSTQPCR